MRLRSPRSRPIGASMVPLGASGRPSTSARYSRLARAADHSWSARCDRLDFATTSSPDVSRSRRWTMPARRGPLRPPRAGERLGECAVAVARGGMHDHTGGLVHHEQVRRPRTRPRTARPRRPRARRAPPAPRCVPPRAPPGQPVALLARHAVDRDAPRVDQPLRLRPATPAASAARRRRGASPAPPLRRLRRSAPSGPLVAALSITHREPSTPTTMQVSATLNAGQSDRVDEVGHGSLRARSSRLPSAPPSSMPTGSHSYGRSRAQREVDDEQRQRQRR